MPVVISRTGFSAAPGFEVSLFAENLANPRQAYVLPNGDILVVESIREWIRPGENGLLADASDARSLADAILQGLEDKDLRGRAAGLNQELIIERAEYSENMRRVEEFYAGLVRDSLSP